MYIPIASEPGAHLPRLIKRQFTGNAGHDTNITIGIIVAIVLTVFIIGVGAFMYTYRDSIRFTARRRRKKGDVRRKSTGSAKSSKSEKSAASDGGGDPPPPP
ncbi:hypothetical protein jhhlp_000112 [Lomentospora prolificans]|uniref:Uncharacterized protein n=1 Tax=Lomentospora prolificans TaxID=41688 RepID=A0A2N3NLR5_9PEZI|nr:hypothetical protein jhhlp_000112 [Lomentospora prolificans]